MPETILNIYLVIEKGKIISFRAKDYQIEGDDNSKIKFLKENAKTDFNDALVFPSPQNKRGEFLTYNKFYKLEKQGMQYQLFEEIFLHFNAPQNPLVCVTPVVDGEIYSS
ncbi:MAG: hypothetical protein AB1695_02695 [Stygiobacter sp.]|jgi:hypothetical protein|uniref:Uncharacterized protein n=1 Tax=Stygiobacter electus TaxID=3032292 RepID=A0AAE3TC22_9BACT|nr:hypothetical protein [Stygiobacter electus]MDF1611041.1 hypothetical protein [Stygiobacter electus]